MKKILLLTAAALSLFTSCSLDVNEDPYHAGSIDATLELPSAQSAIAAVVGDGMFTPSGIFVQYYDQLPESEQYKDLVRYMFTQSSSVLDRSYATLYSGALADLDDILKSTTATAADKYVAQILRTYCYQLSVDNWDKAPYKEALQGNGNTQPKWEDGEVVYKGVINELDSVENLLDGSQISADDMVAGGDLSQWRGFANALRLRMYMRFIDGGVDVANYTAKVKALVAANNFFTGDFKFDNYKDEADRRNPWYSSQYVNLNTTNLCAGYALLSYMKSTNDNARIAYNFAKDGTGNYTGTLPATKYAFSDIKNANVSELRYYATQPVYFFTQAELQFLIAEVELRFNNNEAAAKTAYEAAIASDFNARGITDGSVVDGFINGAVKWSGVSSVSDKLNLIYMQKWVALYGMDPMEAWSEQRRTDVPTWSTEAASTIKNDPGSYTAGQLIIPAVNALGGSNVVKRQWFPDNSRKFNPNAPEPVNITTPVWWDVK
jgi:hypothetical protein